MPEYPYPGAYDLILSDVQHGPGVTVVRNPEREPDDPYPYETPDGSTVVLRQGDVLVTDAPLPFFHALLPGTVHPAPPADDTAGEAPAGQEEPSAEDVPRPKRTRNAPAADDKPAGDSPDDAPTA